jgi:hypothetical protein
MFGVAVPGKLGGGGELAESSELFERNVINPYKEVVQEAVQSLLRASGLNSRVVEYGTITTEANVEQSYTGIQIANAVEVVQKVQTGELTKKQAIQILVSMLGFELEQAEQMFEDDNLEALFSSEQVNLTDAFNHLMECGEEVNEEEWELIDARKVDYEKEGEQDAIWKFASVIDFEPGIDSEQDNEIIKVRYAYMPKVTGTPDSESRDFCKMMVGAGNRVWKKEDIEAASGANPGWGANGSARYSIWLYKGGGSCQHFWERRTFLQKNNKRVSVNEARKLLREAGLDPLERNESEVAKRPRDMKNRGFLEPKKWTTPR